MSDEIELLEGEYQLLSSEVSSDREKELADRGIILNYKIVSDLKDRRSDNNKVLASYQNQRARQNLNKVIVPLLIKSAKEKKNQDTHGNAKTSYLVSAVYGANAEDVDYKRNLN